MVQIGMENQKSLDLQEIVIIWEGGIKAVIKGESAKKLGEHFAKFPEMESVEFSLENDAGPIQKIMNLIRKYIL